MNIKIREDSVEIEGYVNAIERNSKPLLSRVGRFIERICKGAFARAIERNNDIHVLLNHNWARDLGSTARGNLELCEDSIGLRARATITDAEIVEKARNGELVGWSFGFADREVVQETEQGMPLRLVRDLDLFEVSILDNTKSPAYDGTLIMARAEDDIQYHGEPMYTEVVRELINDAPATEGDTETTINYSRYEEIIKEMKGAL